MSRPVSSFFARNAAKKACASVKGMRKRKTNHSILLDMFQGRCMQFCTLS
jgi:hypothetical protein